MLSHRFLLLIHRGRRAGGLYHTIPEAAHYAPTTHGNIVLSANGDRADWFRNLKAYSPVEVRTGRSWYVPEWYLLDPDGRLAALHSYQRRYQLACRAVMHLLGYPYDGTAAGSRVLANLVVMIAFHPLEARQSF